MNKKDGLNPYVAGGLAGILAVLSVLVAGKFFGASTSFVRVAGMIEKIFAPEKVAQMDYFIAKTPKFDWQVLFVIGVMLGALISSLITGSFKLRSVPKMWEGKFSGNILKRAVVAFIGGFIAILGVRLAGGCPSGHGLSGLIQLSVSGFIALACFFIGGVIVANLLYKGGQR